MTGSLIYSANIIQDNRSFMNIFSTLPIILYLLGFFLLQNAQFILFIVYFCLQKTLRDNEESSSTEILPANWNENSTAYALRYVYEHKVYILLGTVANDTIILNLLVSGYLKCARADSFHVLNNFNGNEFHFRTASHFKSQTQHCISKTR